MSGMIEVKIKLTKNEIHEIIDYIEAQKGRLIVRTIVDRLAEQVYRKLEKMVEEYEASSH